MRALWTALLCRRPRKRATVIVVATLATLPLVQSSFATDTNVTVVNSCSYTVYPGIYPASYQNGGWEMAPNTSVTFSLPNPWNGRIWGRIGCDGSSPAICQTGSCGGTGLQCAGTTGATGTSLVEMNLDYAPNYNTDNYDVSYVDGIDNPIGLTLSNSSCVSPSTCTAAPLTNCPSGLAKGPDCQSPCTAYGTDQFCCSGADDTPSTCIESAWPTPDQQYVTDIHNACPNDYAWAYDDNIGDHNCPTGSSYTITFCPNGSGTVSSGGGSGSGGGGGATNGSLNGSHLLAPQNAPGLVLDDVNSGTGAANPVDIYTDNSTGAQTWVLSDAGTSPAGSYNIAVSYGPYCLTASGTASTSAVVLEPCNGSSAQAWNAVPSSVGYTFNPANNPSLCLDVRGDGTTPGTLVQAYTCNGGNNEQWVVQ